MEITGTLSEGALYILEGMKTMYDGDSDSDHFHLDMGSMTVM